jgi:hypothetical protein
LSSSAEQSSNAARFLELLRKRFTVEPLPAPGRYRITAHGDQELDPPPILNLDRALFDDYLDSAVAEWPLPPGVPDRTAEALSLMGVHVEAALASVDASGLNYVRELGLRRDTSGVADWYQVADEPETVHTARSARRNGALRWEADRPQG